VAYTVGFNEKTFVDATGAPHTDEMTTMERIRRISPTELEDVTEWSPAMREVMRTTWTGYERLMAEREAA
jgi:hypothetical protein